MSFKNEPLYSISVASRLVGVSPRVLRSYEDAKLISPYRTDGQTRLFSNQDINKLKVIYYLHQEKEINLAGIKAIFQLMKHFHQTQVPESCNSSLEENILNQLEEIAPDL